MINSGFQINGKINPLIFMDWHQNYYTISQLKKQPSGIQ